MLPNRPFQSCETMRPKRTFFHLTRAGITCSLLWALIPTLGSAQDNSAQEVRDCTPTGVRTDVRPDQVILIVFGF